MLNPFVTQVPRILNPIVAVIESIPRFAFSISKWASLCFHNDRFNINQVRRASPCQGDDSQCSRFRKGILNIQRLIDNSR